MLAAYEYTHADNVVSIHALPPPALAPAHLLPSLPAALRLILDHSTLLVPDADALLSLGFGYPSFFLPFNSNWLPPLGIFVVPVCAHPSYYGLRSRVFYPTAPFAN
jgi:hypothetical protein